jgi:hypothetical protein
MANPPFRRTHSFDLPDEAKIPVLRLKRAGFVSSPGLQDEFA